MPSYARGSAYDSRWAELAASGQEIHGEANLVQRLGPRSVLDAGCGTGRVAIELARRGLDVAGVDIDPLMLATAREKAPGIDWHLADLANIDLGRTFDAIVMAGNVMIFVAPGTEGAVLTNLTRHLGPGGHLIAGFQIVPTSLSLSTYDALAEAAGLQLQARWSTWDEDAYEPGSNYAVSIHILSGSNQVEAS